MRKRRELRYNVIYAILELVFISTLVLLVISLTVLILGRQFDKVETTDVVIKSELIYEANSAGISEPAELTEVIKTEDEFYYDIPLDEELQDKVSYYLDAMNIDLDESYIYAMIYKESRFDPNATGLDGDSGYFQILQKYFGYIYNCMSDDFPELVEQENFEYDVYNEYTNLACGIYYLDKCSRDMWGTGVTVNTLSSSLTAYNRGVSGANEYFSKNGTYITTYSSDIVETAHILQENGGL